jgi:hypothetical protein
MSFPKEIAPEDVVKMLTILEQEGLDEALHYFKNKYPHLVVIKFSAVYRNLKTYGEHLNRINS